MTFIVRFLTLVLPVTLIGCSYVTPTILKSSNKEYLSARSIPPLKIPPGVASSTMQSYYPLPYRNYPPNTINVNLTPPGLMD